MLVLSLCEGGGIFTKIEPELRTPYIAFIVNTRPVVFDDAEKGFKLFYETYRSPLDIPIALKQLNSVIDYTRKLLEGRDKTDFFTMYSNQQIEDVFNPDRDPVNC